MSRLSSRLAKLERTQRRDGRCWNCRDWPRDAELQSVHSGEAAPEPPRVCDVCSWEQQVLIVEEVVVNTPEEIAAPLAEGKESNP
jgi:hypothetical protein